MRFAAVSAFAIFAAVVNQQTCLAVSPQTWDHQTEADFTDGQFDSTVVSSLGEITLARKVDVLMPAEQAGEVVAAVTTIGADVYAGSGVEPVVYKISASGGGPAKFAELPGAMVTALSELDGKLLAASAGDEGGLFEVAPDGKATKLWSNDDARYVWTILRTDHGLFLATGPKAAVHQLRPDGGEMKGEAIYQAGKLADNILCLAGAPDGKLLYAGTDKNGLVVEIDPAKKTSRVLMDADEDEIASLAVDDDGGIYAATCDAAGARADDADRPSGLKGGHPTTAPSTQPTSQPTTHPSTSPADDGDVRDVPAAEAGAGSFVQVELDEMMQLMASPSPGERAPTPPAAPLADDEPEGRSVPAGPSAAPDGPPTTMPAPAEASDDDGDDDDADGLAEAETQAAPSAPAAPSVSPRPTRPRPTGGKGNAVYYIRPDGLVETRLRRPVTFLDMILRDGKLYLATGNGGALYAATPDGEVISKLADTDASQVTAMCFDRAGRLVFATANKGSVASIAADLADKGAFTSEALDADQIANWGTARVWAMLPPGTSATISTRSGNVEEPDDATWSQWSSPQPVGAGFGKISSPAGRFLQYRVALSGNGHATPAVTHARLIYQVGNLSPAVAAVVVTPRDKGDKGVTAGGAEAFREIAAAAGDPNGDKLVFDISVRQVGTAPWVAIVEGLDKPKYLWDTRTVPDGDYEIRVVADDDAANPPGQALAAARVSEPVLVDNTPPAVRKLDARGRDGSVVIAGACYDAGSRIASIQYAVDSQEDWVVVGAADGIFDSNSETFRFDLTDLPEGPHRVAVKVADVYGNTVYKSLIVSGD
jgi:hypothetical protein